MNNLLLDPKNPGSFSAFSGFRKNNKKYKYSKSNITKFNDIDFISKHKPVKKKFKRRKTEAFFTNQCWQCDLIDIKKLRNQNNHIRYLLTVIDVFSRYVYIEPLIDKKSESCRKAFEKIFKIAKPIYIYSDLGSEFKGAVRKLFKEYNIIHIETKSIHKAAIVERFNRTIKEKIWRYLSYTNEKKYIDVLQKLVDNYNNSFHRTINMTPKEKYHSKNHEISQFEYNEPAINFKFKIGDYVRIIIDKKLFDKGYEQNWTDEIFCINQLIPSNPPTYKIRSLDGEIHDWKYYNEELNKVEDFDYNFYQVLNKNKNSLTLEKLNSENRERVTVEKDVFVNF